MLLVYINKNIWEFFNLDSSSINTRIIMIYLLDLIGNASTVNLENIYGPYCNPRNSFKPDAGLVRYAGTPWTGSCELNLESYGIPVLRNSSLIHNISSSTKFYIRLLKPPLCASEYVDIHSESGEKITIDCHSKEGSEYYLDTERLKIVYDRRKKFPISPFSMLVTPLKYKTRMYSLCGFDCFTDTYCIDRSLICDRFQNCPNNNIDEAQCEYNHIPPSISSTGKIILLVVLSLIVVFDISSILVCYFCCGINSPSTHGVKNEKHNFSPEVLEEGAAVSLLAQSIMLADNNQSDD
ncbi:unnamed protein product [Rotaria socialis]|uniref:CUB domain-containing protein n=1 Tax=Rotaria socialis TaxID=392032 RepID=A0A820RD47_9BILA|nr:unnamed protein product [Rotaria socialis]